MLTIPIVVEVQEFHLCKNEKRNVNLHHSHYISQGQKQKKKKKKGFTILMILTFQWSLIMILANSSFSYDNLEAIIERKTLYFVLPYLILLSNSTLGSRFPTTDVNFADNLFGVLSFFPTKPTYSINFWKKIINSQLNLNKWLH